MSVIGYFLEAVATVLDLALTMYLWIVVARAVISWVNPDPYNPIVRFLYSVTEPVLAALRRRLPLFGAGVDFTPVVLILAIYFVQIFVVNSLHHLAGQFL